MYTLKSGSLSENAPISQKQTQLAGLSGRKCAQYKMTRGENLWGRHWGLGSRGWGWRLEQPRTINLIPNYEFRTRFANPESHTPSPDHLVRHYMLASKGS
jgi:hypothetical protein